jgi:hypothetical protein
VAAAAAASGAGAAASGAGAAGAASGAGAGAGASTGAGAGAGGVSFLPQAARAAAAISEAMTRVLFIANFLVKQSKMVLPPRQAKLGQDTLWQKSASFFALTYLITIHDYIGISSILANAKLQPHTLNVAII